MKNKSISLPPQELRVAVLQFLSNICKIAGVDTTEEKLLHADWDDHAEMVNGALGIVGEATGTSLEVLNPYTWTEEQHQAMIDVYKRDKHKSVVETFSTLN